MRGVYLLIVLLLLTACTGGAGSAGRVTTTASLRVSDVPRLPSVARVEGRRLMVRKRLRDGTLAAEEPYVMKGVAWSPCGKTSKANGELHWRLAEFARWYATDIPLMQAMNVNTVYVFTDFGTDETAWQILDELYRRGIMAVVTVDWDGTADLERLRTIVSTYKEHPAILLWAIGNEWNINLFHGRLKTLADAAAATESLAQEVKKLDKQHPVASIFGEIVIPNQNPSARQVIRDICPSVDLWGVNIYRGSTFGTLFEQWRTMTEKPVFISEYGTDSFYTERFWPAVGHEDQKGQAEFVGLLCRELGQNLSARDPAKVAIGGTVFEWVDEWWKAGPVYEKGVPIQGAGGFPTPWNRYSHPDGFANETYFGLLQIDRTPKQVYYELQKCFGAPP